MFTYFQSYYINQNFGPAYIVTQILCVVSLVFLLNDVERSVRGLLKKLAEIVVCWVLMVAYCSAYSVLFGHTGLDTTAVILVVVLYAALRSKYKPRTRLLSSFSFLAFWFMALPISEPIGNAVENYVNADYTWAENLTSLVMILLTVFVVWFLRQYSAEKLTYVPKFPQYLICLISVLCIGLGIWGMYAEIDAAYKVVMSAGFFFVELTAYYMFYTVSKEFEENMELVAVQKKEELEQEMMRFSHETYEEMHQIRHEIKNHLTYIQFLAENGEYDKMKSYLDTVVGETENMFQFIECGNDIINAVMNHAVKQAKAQGVSIDAQIVVPPDLPYEEVSLCSLLSNLMDNAIEGAAQSGQENPVITVQIIPRQDYLFFRVINPVRSDLSTQRILSLRTTKKDKRSHGYGTGVIRSVAEGYQGSANFDVKDGNFIADIMLSLEGKEEEKSDGTDQTGNL